MIKFFMIQTLLFAVALIYFLFGIPNAFASHFNFNTDLVSDDKIGKIFIYNARVTLLIPSEKFKGILVYKDGKPSDEAIFAKTIFKKDIITPEVFVAHDNITKTQLFYYNVFGRASYDNQSAPVHVAVNVNKDLSFDLGMKENAVWMENLKLFAFGDGAKGELQNFINSLEVVAHEFTHAVISSTSRLEYEGQSGALNEHLADVFGVMARQYYFPDYQNLFLVGDQALTSKGKEKAQALRDMLFPNKGLVWQPEDMKQIPEKFGVSCKTNITNDNCGVHILSGIPNRAVALMVQKLGWIKIRNIIYPVMTVRLNSKSQFSDYRHETLLECEAQLDKDNCQAVKEAFDTVGIL